MNALYYGDNLHVLREQIKDESVDLIYLDPPFNSKRDYNVLFREASGEASQAQFHAFTDTWNWADAAQTYAEFVDTCLNTAVVEMVEAAALLPEKLSHDGLPRHDGPAPGDATFLT